MNMSWMLDTGSSFLATDAARGEGRAVDPNAVQCGAAGFDWGEDSFMLYCVYYRDCDILKYQIDYTCAASGSDSSSESREARRATYVRILTKYSDVDTQRQYEHQL